MTSVIGNWCIANSSTWNKIIYSHTILFQLLLFFIPYASEICFLVFFSTQPKFSCTLLHNACSDVFKTQLNSLWTSWRLWIEQCFNMLNEFLIKPLFHLPLFHGVSSFIRCTTEEVKMSVHAKKTLNTSSRKVLPLPFITSCSRCFGPTFSVRFIPILL